MNWAILVVAGLFEIGWAIGLKYTDGFTRLLPTVWTSPVDDNQPWTVRYRHEGPSSRDGLQCLGRGGSCRHRDVRNCFVWRTCERGPDDQRYAHTRWDCRPQALNILTRQERMASCVASCALDPSGRLAE